MKKRSVVNGVIAGLMLGVSTPTWAHTGIGVTHSFMAGLAHPWQGMDHFLVMLAIGLWACVLGGRALWLLPMSFLMLMVVGAGLGFAGVNLPVAEFLVATSVVAVGWVLVFNWRASLVLATGLTGIFALFHGYVHAGEVANNTGALSYCVGFLLTTALLQGLGIATGLLSAGSIKILRLSFGVLCSSVGLVLLAGYVV
jgi:urease accessory protein